MNLVKKTLLFYALVLPTQIVFAQTIIKGQVVDNKTFEAIPFAAIYLKSNSTGTPSDLNGWFSISCFQADTISIRCLGYKQVSVPASEIIQKKTICMIPDTVMIREVIILPENAYKMLLLARDSTNKYQKKSFQGICNRQDKISFNNIIKRKSDATLLFNVKNIKDGHNEIDYWLENIETETSIKISEQPYLAYPNTIPINLFSVRWPSREEIAGLKCTVTPNSDNLTTIKVIHTKPTRNLINEAIYYINKQTWIIEGIKYTGDFTNAPVKKSNRYHYKTNIQLAFNMVEDSCILSNFNYNIAFSHKKIDPQNLWKYEVNMEVSLPKGRPTLPESRKLSRLNYLLYMDNKH